ncbi:NAD-dependent epimerase/dehydratase family protein [Mycobacterium sp. KBS0706]|uniref:NmrA family NAD(P)-binding protein n=1 Tax=Mycobacterium sp. KBS0706 TaxID=2578109 RepID=UPI00110FEF63|nr:NAD(P)H-binding protein [Mycobacterium sp. KBS0706]TSD83415.1 NAD-dependent epimerase/dehydratase family protein [Mycobacterium sp. KBS0706]
MYAITGITGQVGGALARHLLAAGERVRAVLRDPHKGEAWAAQGCEIAVAGMDDAAALAKAFAGATAVFILPPPVFDPKPGYPEARRLGDTLVQALTAARPGRVLQLSTIGADAAQDNLLSQHTLLEAALRDVPLPLTILRPAWFVENAAWDVASARDEGVIRSFLAPTGRPVPMVATADIGRIAAELIREDRGGRRVVELEGPRRVSPDDLAAAFAAALGRPVRVEPVPRETWENLFRSQGMKNPMPRIRMLDGFNEGWIDFRDGGSHALKGRVEAAEVIAELVARG